MSDMHISVKVNLSDKTLTRVMNEVQNPITKYAIYNTLKKKCDPYVPMLSGNLAESATIYPSGDEEGLHYGGAGIPYAHYQYYGEVYGPNFPIYEDGVIVGWRSRKNEKKHPMGRKLNYKKDYHALATSFWNKAMLRDKGDEFRKEVKDIIEEFIRRTENGK